jgi:hypothetical protein
VVEAGHQACPLVLERRSHSRKILGPDERIAVRDNQHIVARALQHVDQIADFAVRTVLLRVDYDVYMSAWELGSQSSHDTKCGVGAVADPEYNLELRIVLEEERSQVRVQTGFRAAQRLEHGDCGAGQGGCMRWLASPSRYRIDGQQGVRTGQR